MNHAIMRRGQIVTALFPHLPFDPIESHLSFAARLAAKHTGGRVAPFLNDLGIRSADFARGERDAIIALCDRAGVDAAPVIANTPISLGRAHYLLRGEKISADLLSNPFTVICPACLLADDETHAHPALARRGRFEWPLRVVRTCPVHGMALVERPRASWDDQFHELAVRVPERGDALHEISSKAPRRSVSALQAYASSRLNAAAGPAWLDSQSLEQAVRVTELLGVLVEFGVSRKVSTLTTDEWDQAGRVGFDFTSCGEVGIRKALHQVQAAFRKTGGQPRHRNVFGRLYEWASSSKTAKHPGDINRILREHMFNTVEMAAGEVLLGEALPERRLHSVASLAAEAGLHPSTLRNVLIAKGIVDREDPRQVFDAEVGRTLAASVRNLVHVISLPKVLNCSRPQATGLLDEQILLPIATAGAGAPGRTHKTVDADKVDIFLSALASSARQVNVVPSGMASISKAAEKAKTPCVDIVHLILGGFLSSVVLLSSEKGYAAMHVDPEEIRLKAKQVLDGVSPSQAALAMRLPVRTVWALLEGPADPMRLPSKLVHGANGRHAFRRISADEVDKFRATYVTPQQIANELEIDRRSLHKSLRYARLRPAISAAEIGVDLYLPDDLPACFRALEPTGPV